MAELAGKLALVSGAARGIGRGIARRFAEAGARVALVDILPQVKETAAEICTGGGQACAIQADITIEGEVAATVAQLHEEFGAVQILVNNAAVMPAGPLHQTEPAAFERCLAVNLRGTYLLSRAVIPGMLAARGGSIIHLASVTGMLGLPGLAIYSATKGALIALTRAMSTDYARRGIRVNCISPGTIDSPMLHRFIAEQRDPADLLRQYDEMHPIGRIGQIEEVAEVCLFLASERASFVTGSNYVVDGGLSGARQTTAGPATRSFIGVTNMEIAPNVHRIPCVFMGDRVAYVHLLIGEDTSILLDTCCAHNPAQEILPYMEQIGFDRERLDYIIISHSDLDHQGGNTPMKAAVPRAKLFCHALDRPWIECTDAIMQGRYLQFDEPHGLATPAEVEQEMRDLTLSCALDGTLEGGERYRLGPDWWVRVVNTPGHTYGHIALYDERSRTLMAGEAAIGTAILDVNDRPVLPPTYCYVDTYLQTIDRLLEMPIDAYSGAHWPVYRERADIQAFLRESREYCLFLEEQLLLYGRQRGRFTLAEAMAELGPRVRRWDESGDGLLTFPFTGNLTRLVQRGLLAVGRNDAGIVEWSVS